MDNLLYVLAMVSLLNGILCATPGELSDQPNQQYSYLGERFRDPFIPLLGQIAMDPQGEHTPQTSSLALKGILRDAQGRIALLVSGANSYILKGGRLYDGRNKMVKGISGVIKQDSVVVVGADRAVRELKVKAAL